MVSYTVSNLLFCCLLGAGAATFAVGVRRWPDLWRVLPRQRVLGEALGVVCLVWSVYHVLPMLEGGLARYRPVIKLLVPVTAVLAYFYLNYIFTRALGGFLLLAVTYLLHAAFVARIPVRPLYSLACYAIAAVGMLLVATPWRFRDTLQKATQSARWRWGVGGTLAGLTLFFAVFAFLG